MMRLTKARLALFVYSASLLTITFAALAIVLGARDNFDNAKEKPLFECRINVSKITTRTGFANELAVLEVQLKNVSDKPINIINTFAPGLLQFMKQEVQTPDGKTLTIDFLAESLTPGGTPTRMAPGAINTAYLRTIGFDGPGAYKVQAIFEYEKIKVVSPVVEIELKELK